MKSVTSAKRAAIPVSTGRAMVLAAATAAELMKPNPLSIRSHAHVQEALALLSDHAFSAVPVINAQGHPIGVLSRTDLVRFERERVEYLDESAGDLTRDELTLPSGESLEGGFLIENAPTALVSEAMTPKVLSVTPHTPAAEVIRTMLQKRVHRLFVVDDDGVLIGVISTMDILEALRE